MPFQDFFSRKNANIFIHSFKLSIALVLAYMIPHLLGLPLGEWAVITAVIVMLAQPHVGDLLRKSYLRLIGTLIGATVGILCLTFFGANPMAISTTLFFFGILFTWISTLEGYSYAGILAAVTMAIVLTSPQPSVKLGGLRILEVVIGITIGTLVSRFVLPIFAYQSLRRNLAEVCQQLNSLYFEKVEEKTRLSLRKASNCERRILKLLIDQDELLKASILERNRIKRHSALLVSANYHLRKIFRLVDIVFESFPLTKESHEGLPTKDSESLSIFHQTISEKLKFISILFSENKNELSNINLYEQSDAVIKMIESEFPEYKQALALFFNHFSHELSLLEKVATTISKLKLLK